MSSAQNKQSEDFFTAGVGQTSPTAPSLGVNDLNIDTWQQTMSSANTGQLSGVGPENSVLRSFPNAPSVPDMPNISNVLSTNAPETPNASPSQLPIEPARVGQAVLQGYVPPSSTEQNQSTLPQVADFGLKNEVLPNMVERQAGPGFGVSAETPAENLENVARQPETPSFRENKALSDPIQTEGDRLSSGAIVAVENLERQLGQDGRVASFYDEIRSLMEENLRASFNREVGNE